MAFAGFIFIGLLFGVLLSAIVVALSWCVPADR